MPTYLVRTLSNDIVQKIEKKGSGYLFIREMSPAKRTRFVRDIGRIIERRLFTDEFFGAVFEACLTHQGLPCERGHRLFRWCLRWVFASQKRRLFLKWHELVGKGVVKWKKGDVYGDK